VGGGLDFKKISALAQNVRHVNTLNTYN